MSSLHHESILEDCFEVASESFRINNKLTHEQLDELLSFSKELMTQFATMRTNFFKIGVFNYEIWITNVFRV